MHQSLHEISGFPILEHLRVELVTQQWKNQLDESAREVTLALLSSKLKYRGITPDRACIEITKYGRDGTRELVYHGGFFELTVEVTPHRTAPTIEVVGVEHVTIKFGIIATLGERWEVSR